MHGADFGGEPGQVACSRAAAGAVCSQLACPAGFPPYRSLLWLQVALATMTAAVVAAVVVAAAVVAAAAVYAAPCDAAQGCCLC